MYTKLVYGNYYTSEYINQYFDANSDEEIYFYEFAESTKVASDIDVTRYNSLDTTKVFRVLPPAIDLGGAHVTIDSEHEEIHKGNHFFNSRVLAIPANQTYTWVVEVGEKVPHVVFEISANNGALSFETYETITASEDGTLQTLLNNNRNSDKVSTLKMRLNPTTVSTTSAQMLRDGRVGTVGGTGVRTGGSVSRNNEIPFKKNTKYLLTMTNLVNETNYVNLTHNWYEV